MPQTILGQYAALLPTGTTAQRPSGQSGYIRYNTDTNALEFYSSLNWETISTEKISNLTTHGGNAFALIKGGKVFTTHGSTGGFNYYLSGRGPNGRDPYYGVNTGLKEVPIPTNSPVITLFAGHTGGMGALLANGDLYMWGTNADGQLGTGNTTARAYPYLTMTGVAKVWGTIGGNDYNGAAQSCTFIKKTDNLVYTCGSNSNGQLGLNVAAGGNETSWTLVPGFAANSVVNVFPLGTAGACTFIEKSDGTIWATGTNVHGQLGTGNQTQQIAFVDVTTNWGGNLSGGSIMKMCYAGYFVDDAVPAAASTAYTVLMLRKTAGGVTSVYACGSQLDGIMGNLVTSGNISTPFNMAPSTFSSVKDISLMGGYRKTCHILLNNGNCYSTGWNAQGNAGDGTFTTNSSPLRVYLGGSVTFRQLMSNQQGSFGATTTSTNTYLQTFVKGSDGFIYGCGFEDSTGYLGTTTQTAKTSTFTKVAFPASANIIEMGSFLTAYGARIHVALSDKNNLYVWGNNTYNGVTAFSTTPPQLPAQIAMISPSG